MTRASALILKALIILLGVAALAVLLIEPNFEGRNVNSTLFQVYFNDPFLAYAYIASISFFVGLHQAFKLAGYAERNNIFSRESVRALQNIRYCAVAIILFAVGAEAYIFLAIRGTDDIAGGVAIGLFVICISAIIAGVAALCERFLQSAVSLKYENGLTV